jgi:hypothetical protein
LVRIAYIAGCERSGTTLLARLLGEIPNFASVGEAGAYFLGPGDLSRIAIPCGCGDRMSECSFWGRVTVDPHLRTLAEPFIRTRYIHRALWWRLETHPDLQRLLAAASEFYHTLAALTGAAVIVDSSKSPVFAALLSRAPGIEVHMIHMIRDLRGIVSSWQRPKAYISTMPPRRCVLQWYRANVGVELLKGRAAGFSRLRYEDFVAHPRPMLEQMASAIRGFPVRCPFLRDGHAHVHAQHLVGGNPDKFQCGEIPLRQRQPELGPGLSHVVTLAGAPMLMRYGYPSRRRSAAIAVGDPLTASVGASTGSVLVQVSDHNEESHTAWTNKSGHW